jgi:DNA-binding CsgD family transcriptional regulator
VARTLLVYGAVLGAGALILQWLDYQRVARLHSGEFYIGVLALAFTALGIWVGAKAFRQPRAAGEGFVRNTTVVQTLGISEREFEVLELLAAGKSNKEISARLNVSPNTVKTHVARIYEKLEVKRRTEAVLRARELGMLP